MILFEIDSQGYVTSTPSLIPQGMALSDIVIITESDYELVTLRLIPPSGRYIPDVVCTPVKTQNKSATLWQALLPAEAAAMHGVLTYQIFRRNVQGRVIPTQEGALTVQRGVISDMPENVGHLETYSIDSLYKLLSQIHAKDEDHDRGIDKNASDIAALDERVSANADEIADNAERIETNADNHLQLLDRLYGEDGEGENDSDGAGYDFYGVLLHGRSAFVCVCYQYTVWRGKRKAPSCRKGLWNREITA